MTHSAARPRLLALAAWLAGVWTWAAIAPFDRRDWLLENLLVFAYVGLLAATYRRFAFSDRTYALFTMFLSLHLVGSHYTYSLVPIGAWLQDALDLSRNHYDRFVHFSYGFLLAPAFREALVGLAGTPPRMAAFLAVNLVLAFSAFFEVVEVLVAMIVSPELGDAYLGTQGDPWDAQKDMGLALLGASLTSAMLAWRARGRPIPS